MSDKQSVYNLIKKQNGEGFARAIREFDSGIFDVPNLPAIVRYAGRDAFPLLNYLESLKQIEIKESASLLLEDPFTLLKKAGYDAFYADTLKKQNSIQYYYADMESLCTFRDPNRFKDYHIIHAIKEGADKLNRRDFNGKEKREDEYGTSVISIQILKKGGFISIKNRYNHTVEAPDNTFKSNPDNIIAGLSQSLKDYFSVDFASQPIDFDRDFILVDKRIFKYHLECQNRYFGDGFYVFNNKPYFINRDYQLLIDNFIVDFKENKVFQTDVYFCRPDANPEDAVFELIKQEVEAGGKLTLKKEGDLNLVYLDDRCIIKSKEGQMIGLYLNTREFLENPIFLHHDSIEEVVLENVKGVVLNSFKNCKNLKKVLLPNCFSLGDYSLYHLPQLQEVDLKKVNLVGNRVLTDIGLIEELNLPCLSSAGEGAFSGMRKVKKLSLPRLILLRVGALSQNPCLQEVELPKLNRMEAGNLSKCPKLERLELKNLAYIGWRCLSKNENLKEVNLPFVRTVQVGSLCCNESLTIVHMPKLTEIGDEVFSKNKNLKKLILNQLKRIEENCFCSNQRLEFLSLQNVTEIGYNCFYDNPNLKRIYLGALEKLSNYNLFLCSNKIKEVYAPLLQEEDKAKLVILCGKQIKYIPNIQLER